MSAPSSSGGQPSIEATTTGDMISHNVRGASSSDIRSADVRLSPACAPITTGGDVNTQTGFAHSVYSITSSMVDAYFYNGDAEMLFVFEHGNVRFWTEFGIIDAEPARSSSFPVA